MEYSIDDLKKKVKLLKTDSSEQLVKEIESLLRDIRRSDNIPYYQQGDLADALVQLNNLYPRNICSNIPYLVRDIIDKMIGRN